VRSTGLANASSRAGNAVSFSTLKNVQKHQLGELAAGKYTTDVLLERDWFDGAIHAEVSGIE
jgi:hypothetical protein